MAEKLFHITSVRKQGNQRLISFDHRIPSIRAGQFLLGYCPEKDDRICDIYYARDLDNGYFSLPMDILWEIGDEIIYKGPIGKGFSPLDLFENILCLEFTREIRGLSALIEDAVQHDKNIAFYGKVQQLLLDQSIEILREDMLTEAIRWADFIAIETSSETPNLDPVFVDKLNQAGIPVEIMIHTPILCSGEAGCMVCSIKTKNGWRKTCQSGSVFNLIELETT